MRRQVGSKTTRYVMEREAEVVSISRDTTESDLKQRRELHAGSVRYVNQPVVEAALHCT